VKSEAFEELKKAEKYKPIDGVSFVQYDRYGNKIDPSKIGTEDDIQKYIAKDDDHAGFEFIPAS